MVDSLQHPVEPPLDDALDALAGKTTIAFAGRGVFRGVAEAASLMLMELARMPALGFEIGQFRHGPLELLSPDIGVVLLCGDDADEAAVASLARDGADAGSTPVIFDCSGGAPVERGERPSPFRPRRDLAAVFADAAFAAAPDHRHRRAQGRPRRRAHPLDQDHTGGIMNDQSSGRPAQPTIHVIGGVTVDLIMGPVAPWPRPGTETFVNHSELRAGGPAGNTALALRALNVRHRVVSNIGNDMFGAVACRHLRRNLVRLAARAQPDLDLDRHRASRRRTRRS